MSADSVFCKLKKNSDCMINFHILTKLVSQVWSIWDLLSSAIWVKFKAKSLIFKFWLFIILEWQMLQLVTCGTQVLKQLPPPPTVGQIKKSCAMNIFMTKKSCLWIQSNWRAMPLGILPASIISTVIIFECQFVEKYEFNGNTPLIIN